MQTAGCCKFRDVHHCLLNSSDVTAAEPIHPANVNSSILYANSMINVISHQSNLETMYSFNPFSEQTTQLILNTHRKYTVWN